MRVLAFDFDGVLCDSSREVFVVAVDTLADLEPDSALLGVLRPLRDDALAGGDEFRDHEIYIRFSELLPLGNRAEDFGVALRAIEESKAICDQTGYDAFYAGLPASWRDLFHRRFYEARSAVARVRPGSLAGAPPPLPRSCPRPSSGTGATSSRRWRPRKTLNRSICCSTELGLEDLFDPRFVLDKETGVEKTIHLGELQRRTGAPFADITFIDDKLNHLVKVAGLGVRCVLAGWGFNTDREHDEARRLGFEVAHLDDLDKTVFKGE